MLKRFRIEDSDDDDEEEAGGDEEIDKISNNDSYMLPGELKEVIKSSSGRVMCSVPNRSNRSNLAFRFDLFDKERRKFDLFDLI